MAVQGAAAYWFSDQPKGGCKPPKSWRLLYRAGTEWKPVGATTAYATAENQYCEVRFQPVTTDALRLEVQLEDKFSAGILEWRLLKSTEQKEK
jgi:hypothetical protein